MNQVKVQILKTTITAVYGTLVEGAQLRTSPEFAAHLVDECGAAKYAVEDAVSAAPVADPVPVVQVVVNTPPGPAADQQDTVPASGGGGGGKPDSAIAGEGGSGTESVLGAEQRAEGGPITAGGDGAADAAAKSDAVVQTSAQAPKRASRQTRKSSK